MESGADVAVGTLSVAHQGGTTGTITVTGADSTLTQSGQLILGHHTSGTATIHVESEGTFTAGAIAVAATGTVNVTAGGKFSVNGDGDIDGTVNIMDTNSSWTNGATLVVGRSGTGTMEVTGGGMVIADITNIGLDTGAVGAVTVGGAGSSWSNGGDFTIGGDQFSAGGTGTLTVGIGGTVNVAQSTKIWNDGTVNLDGGTLNTGALEFAGSTFNFTSGTLNITGSQAIDSALLEKVLGSQTLSSGKNLIVAGVATLTEPFTVDGGTLSVGQLVGAPLLSLQRGTLILTAQALVVEAGGLLGDRLELRPDVILNVVMGTTNRGLIWGSGLLGGPLVNEANGEIRAQAGDTLTFTGATASNSGDLRLLGGTLDLHGPLTNAAAGRITGRGPLVARGGLANQGHIAFSNGVSDVYGDVNNDTTNAAVGITVSGNADVTFWGDVTNTSGLFRVSAGSSATFFGGMSGNGISGGGDVYLESDITPGASPGIASFGGNVHFGVLTNLNMEIAGTTKGAEYDALDIAGTATLDGTLDVSLPGGFVPRDGDVFEILTAAGGISGTFATEIFPILSGNLFWNVVYSTNSVALQVAAPGLPGDYNQNGIVDAADYVLWRDMLGEVGEGLSADGNGNGEVDAADYGVWRTNFGTTATLGGEAKVAVPEPPASFLLFAASMLLWQMRRNYALR